MRRWLLLLSLLLWWTPNVHAQQQSDTKPLVITVNPSTHQAVMTWTATVSSGITGYHVWRTTTSGSGYTQIGGTLSGTTTFTDTTVHGSTTYFWVVTSYSPACPTSPTCGESANSNEITAVIPGP